MKSARVLSRNISTLLFAGVAVSISHLFAPMAQAAPDTWDGGGDAVSWQDFLNWESNTQFPGVTSGFGSTDDATFGITGATGTIDLGGIINIRSLLFGVAGGDAASFSIGDADDTLNFTTGGGVTINAGVTAGQQLGVAGTTLNFSTVANSATTFANNGTGLLTIGGNIVMVPDAGNSLFTVAGSGNTSVTGTITETGAGNSALLKTGTGTLTLSNGSTWSGNAALGRVPATAAGFPLVAREGTLLLNGGTHTVNGEAVIGGVVADGGAGQNAKIQVDAGTFAVTGFLSVGRGNGIGGVSSDLVLNNGAIVTAGNLSAGFNGGNGLNLPKGVITLSNTSSFSINTNGAFFLAESAGSNFGMTLNDSASVAINGAGSATNRSIGHLGSGVLTMNGTSQFSGGTSILNVGYQTGSGVINLNEGTFTLASELRVGATNANGVFAGGSGTVNVQGGTMTLNALTLARSNDGAGKLSGAFNVSSGNVTVTTGLTIVGYNGDGTGGGTLNITGGTFSANGTSGTNSLVVGTANSGRGTVSVTDGVLIVANDLVVAENNLSTGSVTLNSGTINMGTSVLRWLKLNNGSSRGASFTVNGGTLNLNNNSHLRFTTAGGATGTNSFTLNGGLVQGQTGNQNGVVSATSLIDLNQAATGAANNTFNLNGGTLHIGQVITTNANNAGGTRVFNFNGGTLKAAGNQAAFFNLGAGTGIARANVRNGGAIINTNAFDVTVAQALEHSNISGDDATDGGLTKEGAGTLTLSGASSYTGPTVIEDGTLALTGSISGSILIDVKSGATFNVGAVAGFSLVNGQALAGDGTVSGALAMSEGSILSPGGGTGAAGTLTFANDLNIGLAVAPVGSAALQFDLGAVVSDKVQLTLGTLFIGGGGLGFSDFAFTNSGGIATGEYTLFDTNAAIDGSLDPNNLSGSLGGNFTGTLGISGDGQDIVLTVVPEPASAVLLLAGFGSMVGLRRLRRRG